MLAVLPLESVSTIELSVRLAARTSSLGASVTVIGTTEVAALIVVLVSRPVDEHPTRMIAATANRTTIPRETEFTNIGVLACMSCSLHDSGRKTGRCLLRIRITELRPNLICKFRRKIRRCLLHEGYVIYVSKECYGGNHHRSFGILGQLVSGSRLRQAAGSVATRQFCAAS